MWRHELQYSCPLEGAHSTEPFVDDDGKCILVTGWNRLSLPLLRSHVIGRAHDTLEIFVQRVSERIPGYRCQTEITDQNPIFRVKQDILWFDIAMYEACLLGMM